MSIKYHKDTLITNDIYLAAYLLSEGYNLTKVLRNDRRRISFLFAGKEIEELRQAYRSGHVYLDIRSFREKLITIRRMMDKKQRSEVCPETSLTMATASAH
jgi:hypothetical protein